MQEFLNRPYRNNKVRQQRKAKAVVYCKHVAKLIRTADKPTNGAIFVPPELTEIAEASSAGVRTSGTKDTNAGLTPTE